MSKTVRLLVYFPLRIFGFIRTLLHERVTVEKVVVGWVFLRAVRCSRASLRALHTHMLPWAGAKGPFFPQCRKTVVIHSYGYEV
jgi:hypothetical protein